MRRLARGLGPRGLPGVSGVFLRQFARYGPAAVRRSLIRAPFSPSPPELSLYELHRKPHEMVIDSTTIAVSPRALHSELMCPICLDLMKNAQTTKEVSFQPLWKLCGHYIAFIARGVLYFCNTQSLQACTLGECATPQDCSVHACLHEMT